MARGINKVILVGNLGADPETRYTAGGSAVTKIRIATSETWRDKQSGEQQERTEWHRVTFFGRLAEIAGSHARKGSPIYVEGTMSSSEWTDKDGVRRNRTEINARELILLNGGGDAQTAPRARPVRGKARDGEERGEVVEDIPF